MKTLERIDQTVWELRQRVRQDPENWNYRRDLLRFFHESLVFIERRAGIPEPGRSFLLLQDRDALACLLLHGAGGTPEEMRPLGDYLHRLGFIVLGVRLPIDRHGSDTGLVEYLRGRFGKRSDESASRPCRPAVNWSGCLAQAEIALDTLLDCSADCCLAGFSFGGTIALNLMRYRKVKGTILLSPGLFPAGGNRYAMFRTARKLFPGLTKRIMPVSSATFDLVALTRSTLGEEIHDPILLIQSADDPVVSARGYQFLQKRSRNPASRFVLLPSGGHVIVKGTQAETVFRTCGDFIRKI